MTTPLRIGIAGLGTVGIGTLEVLSAHAEMFASRVSRPLTVTAVAARDWGRDRGVDLHGYECFDNAVDMAYSDDVDVVVELIGGSDGIPTGLGQCEAVVGQTPHTPRHQNVAARRATAQLSKPARGAGCPTPSCGH